MLRPSLLAILCVLTINSAKADHIPDAGKMVVPPGLAKVMTEGAGRVVNPTCDDVRAVVARVGEAGAVEMAREAGASNPQIERARRCLK